MTLAQSEREQIVRALKQTHYNQSAAARQLGIERHRLRRKMSKYGIPFHRTDTGDGPADHGDYTVVR